jgi:hypothetical protein
VQGYTFSQVYLYYARACVYVCFNHKQVLLNCCGLPVGQNCEIVYYY